RIRRTVLGFKYWPDEPGVDSMCTWSENHHILFASAGYLAGQRYPDAVFTNSGKTGRDQMAVMRPRVMRWLELRFRTGFSEWLSNVYYDEDLVALLNLVDFCDDEEIATRAAMVLDLLCADIALNSFRGVFGGTHGRTYENERKYARHENTTATQYLLFGRGAAHAGGISAPCLALSERYRPPRVLFEIANDLHARDTEIRQRMGIRVRDAARWGLGFKSVEDGMTWLSLEAYAHPLTINLFVDMLDAFNWWENAFFEDAKAFRRLLGFCRNWRVLPLVALFFRHDVCRNTREEVNIYTYRTPDYMLSTAQDYRKGYGGDQQHIWQATLGPDAVCFTSHPARRHGRSPNYWTGYGTLPRAAQIENVVIEIYNVARKPSLYVANELFFTHAWLPRDRFEECIERDGWVFARRGDGYLAFYSQHPYRWQTERGDDQDREMIVDSPRNVFICEMGRRATDGEFTEFVRRILDAPVVIDGLRVTYQSPSQGHIAWDWTGPLLHNGAPVELREYPRYDSPYGRVAFPNDAAVFRCNGHWLELEWAAARREASAFLEP
ncbi:MAG TPA: hypothetical protein PKI11_12360, partial [Candidatus Hydrogenedentes bacterium]|nr:hypothetical protein [Candidatus Hydrogenedentota bacterium]